MKLVIAGTGYVGLVTGVCLAEIGHKVTCIDALPEKITSLQQGKSPIYEKDLENLMAKNQAKLIYTTDYQKAYKEAKLIFIAVGTPEKPDGSVELTYLYEVALQIATYVEHDCIIVIKSTVPIGTNQKIETFIRKNLRHSVHIEVASNPEFLSQGRAVKDTLESHRIVIGTSSLAAENILKKLYAPFKCPIISTDIPSAEMIKYASNSFLALKISYINEIATLCEKVGANIQDVTLGMGLDPRIGEQFLQAGIGYGGSCFPKDTKALYWLAQLYGYDLKTVKAAIDVNELQQLKLISKIYAYYPSLQNLTIAILGLTFKPETDDLREAPSLKNIPLLLDAGAILRAYDPVGVSNYKKHYPQELIYCDSIDETLKNADICLIFTEWEEIKNFDITHFFLFMKRAIVLDGRNCYSLDRFDGVSITYESIGRTKLGL